MPIGKLILGVAARMRELRLGVQRLQPRRLPSNRYSSLRVRHLLEFRLDRLQ